MRFAGMRQHVTPSVYHTHHLGNLHADVVSQRQGVPLREAVNPGGADMAEVCGDVQVAVALGQRRNAALMDQWRKLRWLHAVAPAELSAWRSGSAMQSFSIGCR